MLTHRRDHLTPTQRRAYDEMLPLFAACEQTVAFEAKCDAADVVFAYDALFNDHFELFWLTPGARIREHVQGEKRWTQLDLVNPIPKEDIPALQAKVDEKVRRFLATVPTGAGDYEKVLLAYEFIADATTYDADAPRHFSLVGALVDGRAACAGCSKALSYLLGAAGVESGIVNGRYGDEGHAWNVVRIDDAYVHVDVTRARVTHEGDTTGKGTVTRHAYCCVTTEEISRSYAIRKGQGLPRCDSHEYDWFLRTGQLVETFSPEAVDRILCKEIDRCARGAEIKFSSDEAYGRATDFFGTTDVFKGTFGERLCLFAREHGEVGPPSVTVAQNDDMRTIAIDW